TGSLHVLLSDTHSRPRDRLVACSPSHSIFFLMLRRPPSSPLFPYTTLFRSDPNTPPEPGKIEGKVNEGGRPQDGLDVVHLAFDRSEEHTSELQSLTNLVCRLLLEKKKPTQNQTLRPPSSTVSADPNIDTHIP